MLRYSLIFGMLIFATVSTKVVYFAATNYKDMILVLVPMYLKYLTNWYYNVKEM